MHGCCFYINSNCIKIIIIYISSSTDFVLEKPTICWTVQINWEIKIAYWSHDPKIRDCRVGGYGNRSRIYVSLVLFWLLKFYSTKLARMNWLVSHFTRTVIVSSQQRWRIWYGSAGWCLVLVDDADLLEVSQLYGMSSIIHIFIWNIRYFRLP